MQGHFNLLKSLREWSCWKLDTKNSCKTSSLGINSWAWGYWCWSTKSSFFLQATSTPHRRFRGAGGGLFGWGILLTSVVGVRGFSSSSTTTVLIMWLLLISLAGIWMARSVDMAVVVERDWRTIILRCEYKEWRLIRIVRRLVYIEMEMEK